MSLMKFNYKHSFFLASFLFCAFFSLGQTYNFRVFNEDNGLPQGYIYHISQDKHGFLFASTGDGLAEFGGTSFKIFRKEDGLAQNLITTHFIDSKNNIWVGHFQEGISYLDARAEKFRSLNFEGLKNVKISCITEDHSNTIWIGTQGNGVFKIDRTFKVSHVDEIEQSNVFSLLWGEDDELLIGSSEGLQIYHLFPEKRKLSFSQSIDLFVGSNVIDLTLSHDSSLVWAAVNGKGVFSLKKSKSEYYISSTIHDDLLSNSFEFRSIYCDVKNNLWVAVFGEGLRKIVPADNEGFSYSVYSYTQKNGLANDYVQSVYCDREGNTWIGTYGSGLVQLVDEKFVFFRTSNGEKEDPVYAVTSDKHGNIWLGTSAGIKMFLPGKKNNELEVFGSDKFKNDHVTSFYTDKNGAIWVGTAEHGLYLFDPVKKNIISLSVKYKLERLHINCITGNEEYIFIGTTEGIYRYEYLKDEYTLLETKDGLLHNNVYHIYVDRLGKLWPASHGTSPYYFANGNATAFKDIPELKSFNINCVAEDGNGKIWFATEGDGIFEYDGNTFKNYSVNEGLASNYCYSLLCDASNNVWVGHGNGISRKNEGAKRFIYYGKHQGIISAKTNLNAVHSDALGNIWYGTSDGIIKYDREKDRLNTTEASTRIIGMTINGTSGKLVSDTVLSYKNYSIRFDFLGVCLTNPENVRYRYILEGFDPEWVEVDARVRTANYPKLEDGKYTFKLLARNNDGIWNAMPVTYTFTISKPIWKSIWFFAILTIILGVSIFLFIKWRTRSLVKLSMRLERMVDEKTYLLKKEKENVEQINAVVEEQNRDITDSIVYAKKIQEAMLPSQLDVLSKINAFIFYQPRDIVSGDFYWYYDTPDSLIIAVMDCTGHGVPGAFMSVIGSTLLNKIVKDANLTKPSLILESLNTNIIESLHQNVDQYSARDGMEAAICSLDLKNKKVRFGGAGRPMYLVRKGELLEFHGSIYSAGGAQEIHETSYHDHEVQLFEGDMIYMFTDGYSDQFGGDKNRKFSSKNLKNLFIRISTQDIDVQEKMIRDTIIEWKGDTMQIDDMLVMGIKI